MDTDQSLTIRSETVSGGAIVLVVEGDLDLQTASDLREAVREHTAGAPSGIVIDLGEVTFLDSSAVGALLEAAALVRRGGSGFALIVGARTQSRSRLDLTGTSRVLNVCYDREEALELVGDDGPRSQGDRAPTPDAQPQAITLTLFLNAASPHAARARAAAEELRRRLPAGAVLEQVDVAERPDLAERHRVLATPMVIRSGPPHRRVVGDLTHLDEVLMALDLPTGP